MALSWLAFVLTFFFHKKPPSPPDKKRDPSSITGIVLQGVSYGIVWSIRRTWFTPMFPNKSFEIGLAVLTMVLAAWSVWFCSAAIRTLGEQWSLAARVVEGHKLVTKGPYSIVRNPIYTGMFGMLLATGLAVSRGRLASGVPTRFEIVDRWFDRVALRSGRRYVTVGEDGRVTLVAGGSGTARNFQWIEVPSGELVLMSLATNRFLRIDPQTGDIRADSPGPTWNFQDFLAAM